MTELSDGYKLVLTNIMNTMSSLRDDIHNMDSKNDTDHENIRKDIKEVEKELGKFKTSITNDWHELDKKVAIRGAIAGLIPSILSIIVMLIAIWRFSLQLSAVSGP